MELSEEELSRLSSHRKRRYLAGRISAEAIRMKGLLGKPVNSRAREVESEDDDAERSGAAEEA